MFKLGALKAEPMAFLSQPDEKGVKHLFTPMRLHVSVACLSYSNRHSDIPLSAGVAACREAVAERIFNVIQTFAVEHRTPRFNADPEPSL